jgi:hypothetical protein
VNAIAIGGPPRDQSREQAGYKVDASPAENFSGLNPCNFVGYAAGENHARWKLKRILTVEVEMREVSIRKAVQINSRFCAAVHAR